MTEPIKSFVGSLIGIENFLPENEQCFLLKSSINRSKICEFYLIKMSDVVVLFHL